MHGTTGEADLSPDDFGAARDARLRPATLDVIGILERHLGPGRGRLRADLAGLFCLEYRVGGILTLLFCQHGQLN